MQGRSPERVARELVESERRDRPTREILKITIEPTMYMKTRVMMKTRRSTNPAFYTKMRLISRKLATINEALGRTCTGCVRNRSWGAGPGAWSLGSRNLFRDRGFRTTYPECPIPCTVVSRFPDPASRLKQCLSRCYTKIMSLAVKSRNPQKIYLVVNKEVNRFSRARPQKTRGEK